MYRRIELLHIAPGRKSGADREAPSKPGVTLEPIKEIDELSGQSKCARGKQKTKYLSKGAKRSITKGVDQAQSGH